MNRLQLADMKSVVSARLESEKAKLAKITTQERALALQLSQLVEQRHSNAKKARSSDDPALRAGADVRWQQWVESRRSHLAQELAMVQAKRAHQIAIVQKAFGRSEVVQGLMQRALKEHRRALARKE